MIEHATLTTLPARILLAAALAACGWLPAWWLAGRLSAGRPAPLFRALQAIGLATVGYISIVNLLGRALSSSTGPMLLWLAANLAAIVALARRPDGLDLDSLSRSARRAAPLFAVAALLAVPQLLLAISTPYWDEVASSAIHVTAANQIADGLHPPRHNAFPDIAIKYHYGFTILSGTAKRILGLTAIASIDVVSTCLWLYTFLFVFHWLRQLRLDRLGSTWGAFAVLLGGGLAWLYLPRIETFEQLYKIGNPDQRAHAHDPALGLFGNLVRAARQSVFHLRARDGIASDLPWDIANQFQQHAVALGIAAAVVAAWLFCTWQGASGPRRRLALALATATFGLLILCHAVFGAVSCLTAGLVIVLRWARDPRLRTVLEGAGFTAAVTALSIAHGGVFQDGPEYGGNPVFLVLRTELGYQPGGLLDFIDWNLAGFGLPLVLALVGLGCAVRRRRRTTPERQLAILYLATMTLVSYLPPQLVYFAYGPGAAEEMTEISKFFFTCHLALALLSAFGLACVPRRLGRLLALPLFAGSAVVPLANCWSGAFDEDGSWKGLYTSPYARAPDIADLGRRFQDHKSGNRDVYFDPTESRGFLGPLLVFGGSTFTISPRRYELTGAYSIAAERVEEGFRHEGRLARLAPGGAERAGVRWLFTRPEDDFERAPVRVRARFDRLRDDGYAVEVDRQGDRALYEIVAPTADLDGGIERYWRPRAVLQALHDWSGDGRDDLPLHDLAAGELRIGQERIALPARDGLQLLIGSGAPRRDLYAVWMADTVYRRGRRIADIELYSPWRWSRYDPASGTWSRPTARWNWDTHIPFLVDIDGDGSDDRIAFDHENRRWSGLPRGARAVEPRGARSPVPVAGRFLRGDGVDTALYEPRSGIWRVASSTSPESGTFRLGPAGGPVGDPVLVPADYDGDGRDDAAVWHRGSGEWWVRDVITGAKWNARFGTPDSVPLPFDYDGDGRVDIAVWRPRDRLVEVSFDRGETVGRRLPVPDGCLPAWTNMY